MDQKPIDQYTSAELSEIKVSALKAIIQAQSTLTNAQQTVQAVEAEEGKRKTSVNAVADKEAKENPLAKDTEKE